MRGKRRTKRCVLHPIANVINAGQVGRGLFDKGNTLPASQPHAAFEVQLRHGQVDAPTRRSRRVSIDRRRFPAGSRGFPVLHKSARGLGGRGRAEVVQAQPVAGKPGGLGQVFRQGVLQLLVPPCRLPKYIRRGCPLRAGELELRKVPSLVPDHELDYAILDPGGLTRLPGRSKRFRVDGFLL